MSEETQGNSSTSNVNDSKDFFDQLEASVNGVVSEGEKMPTIQSLTKVKMAPNR